MTDWEKYWLWLCSAEEIGPATIDKPMYLEMLSIYLRRDKKRWKSFHGLMQSKRQDF